MEASTKEKKLCFVESWKMKVSFTELGLYHLEVVSSTSQAHPVKKNSYKLKCQACVIQIRVSSLC